MAKIKIYETTKELNNNTKDLLHKIKEFYNQVDQHINSINLIEAKLKEEEKRKEAEAIEAQRALEAKKQAAAAQKEKEEKKESLNPEPQNNNLDQSSTTSASQRQSAGNYERVNDNRNKADGTKAHSNREQQAENRDQKQDRKPREFISQVKGKETTGDSQSEGIANVSGNRNSREAASNAMQDNRGNQSRMKASSGNNLNRRYNENQSGGKFQNQNENKGNDSSFKDNRNRKRTAIQKPIPLDIPAPVEKERVSNYDPNRNNYVRDHDPESKPSKSRRALQKNSLKIQDYDDERPVGSKKMKLKKPKATPAQKQPEPIKIEKAVITSEMVTVKDLAEKIGKPAAEIIKKLLVLGILATINQEIDFDTATLVASEFGVELEQKLEKTYEEVLIEEDKEDRPEDLVERAPIVTIMGHVDHGKTSLLDAIRKTKVTEQEAGGITQHIGAYTIQVNGKSITFLDTPGHEAFTAMRARGAQVTDIAILVVAADDGVMPQTIEAINHAKAANVPIIVAINKIDKPSANPERVKQELTEYSLVAEEWGGDTIMVPVSAVTHEGLDHLLEMILLVAEVQELKANPNRLAKGTIIEAQLDKGRGPVATVLVENGTLKVGDTVVAGLAYGRVRAMTDDKGNRVMKAGPSQPVEVIGFSDVPEAGDILYAVEDDKLSRHVVEERKDKLKAQQLKAMAKVSLDELFNQIAEGQVKELNIIVKADVQGSVEAVKQALEKLSNDEVRVRTIHGGVGAITESDVMLASASNAIIIGFNVRPDAMARTAAEREQVDIRLYRIIYNAIEDIEKAMKGLLTPEYEEVTLGRAEVRTTFKVSGVGTICGSYVTDGKIVRNAKVRLIRNGIVVYDGKIVSLKRFKDDAREVAAGYECGIGLENFNDVKDGDIIEAYEERQIERT